MASARENDLNPDVRIGLKLPFNRGNSGLFPQTETTLEQAGSNIKNLLLTAKGERVMQPEFGSRLRELLFEQQTEDLDQRIKEEIQESISFWLPYIVISSVEIEQDETNINQSKVNLNFSLNYEPNRFDSITLNFDNTSESTSGY
jgi:hypothetical protein|tara:strand:+ start:10 stop:444 length:435 start_codon:yes stop_codon:yes gene_type:complete